MRECTLGDTIMAQPKEASENSDTTSSALNVSAETATKLFNDSFKWLDGDKDGFVTQDECMAGSRAKGITDEQELVFSALAEFADDIQGLSNDEWLGESGITKADLNKFSSLGSKSDLRNAVSTKLARGLDVHDPEVFRDTGLKHFRQIDQNGSGGLDKLELESYVKKGEGSERSLEVANVMLEHFDDMTWMSRPNYLKHCQAQALDFYNYDWHTTAEVSRQDLTNVATLRLTPQAEIDAAKSSEYMHSRIKGGALFVAGAAGTVAGVALALAPEPAITKVAGAGVATMGAGMATVGGMLMSSNNPGIERIYSEVGTQRKAMESWSYFNR